MDYGNILRRSWDIIWNHKFMIVLGFLAGIGTLSGGGGNNGSGVNYQLSEGDLPFLMEPEFSEQVVALAAAAGVLLLGLICLFFVIAVVLWLVRLTAEAGMIDAASRLDAGEKVTFGEALSAGWQKIWRMIGLNLVLFGIFFVLAIIIALVMGFSLAGFIGGTAAGFEDQKDALF